jgi:hypothetical protein
MARARTSFIPLRELPGLCHLLNCRDAPKNWKLRDLELCSDAEQTHCREKLPAWLWPTEQSEWHGLVPLERVVPWLAEQPELQGLYTPLVGRLAHVFTWLLDSKGPFILLGQSAEQIRTQGGLLAFCAELPPDLAPLRAPAKLTSWREHLRASNPWRAALESEANFSLAALLAEVRAATSLSFDQVETFDPILAQARRQLLDVHAARRVSSAGSLPQLRAARRALAGILKRRFDLAASDAWILLVLRKALRAALLPLASPPEDELDVIADLGAGNLLRIHALRFPKTEPCAIELRPKPDKLEHWQPTAAPTWPAREGTPQHWVLDGGDVVLLLDSSDSRLLEGSSLPARNAREAERRAHEAALDDDDDYDDYGSGYGADSNADFCDFGFEPDE